MGRAWHGVRDHVFEYARQNFHPDLSEDHKASFIDFVDKGGCEGLQAALQKVTRSDDFQQETTSKIDSDAAEDIVQMILTISGRYIAHLPNDTIHSAITNALKPSIMYDTFMEAQGVFHTALLSIQSLINNVIQGSLEVPSNGEGARKAVSFTVSEVGLHRIKDRCVAMAEGFCEYLDNAKIWIAAEVCLHLVYAVLNETHMQELGWDWLSAIIKLTREGVMPTERIPERRGKVSGRRMIYWLEEARNCRNAWGAQRDVQLYNFRNQAQWEEFCILMGAEDGFWILS